jgi:hypothetical protein
MATEEPSEPGTKRIKCTLSVATIRYLEALSRTGLHGTGVPKVMTSLIEAGVRVAIEKQFIRRIEDAETEAGAPGAEC